MKTRVELLEDRLQQIGQALKDTRQAEALFGLGSVGVEKARMDHWSDLDYFAIVKPGMKKRFLEQLDWMEKPAPVVYRFQNTADGFKYLYQDGIFCEMAVFEAADLASVPYAEGRIIWASPEFDTALRIPKNPGSPYWKPDSAEWSLGELLTCLYVGLGRFRRGEKLSAWRFVQSFCLDRFLELVEKIEPQPEKPGDYYSRDRRFEQRYPSCEPVLRNILLGYEKTPEAALALLEWCEARFSVNEPMAREIRSLISPKSL